MKVEDDSGCLNGLRKWAQKTVDSYQLQRALVLRLSSRAANACDPNLLKVESDNGEMPSSSASVQAMSYDSG
ncbi:Constitutive triple response 1 [Quillaja saponaria]|uniref:Constitutive triple response 1 n=1 Tax=Quillaja saponaria TaxID=32244 RepID=A0AAD7VGP1_QUISA|nr:Constitutive triple response 1 [Quillaja saponaria]